ncbi:hypothetical protein COO91_10549 (plasmid) [Nostoc flagelliforme CCNUN1]|uniref:Uncharacterized protein n=1 Tax=Nostoc flagelliforme CCNUN1 TaxID=2038116 RepID=A0A2K8T9F0_9NOSO|nr:hypothetical protein COO91_10549 [Nostoc flagelliforme CCNUN1]
MRSHHTLKAKNPRCLRQHRGFKESNEDLGLHSCLFKPAINRKFCPFVHLSVLKNADLG